MCVQLPSKWQSRAVGRLEGDRLLGDQSMGINCCGNHLDYSASGKLEVCLFVKNRILHRAVGRLGLQTHGGNWRLPRKRGQGGAAPGAYISSLSSAKPTYHGCFLPTSFSRSPCQVLSDALGFSLSFIITRTQPSCHLPSEPAALKSPIICQTDGWLGSQRLWFD